MTARATAVDRDKKEVTLQDGAKIAYDRLVVSPGIDLVWDSVPGYSEEAARSPRTPGRPGRKRNCCMTG